MRAGGIEAPLEHVAVDHQRAGDCPVARPQLRRPGIDEHRTLRDGRVRFGRGDTLQRSAGGIDQLVDRPRALHAKAGPGVSMTSRRIMRSSESGVKSKWCIAASGGEYTWT